MLACMRTIAAVVAVALALSGQPWALAQSTREATTEAAPPDRAAALDALFDTLRAAGSEDDARAAEDGIATIWLQSGSDTVDLMMDWTLSAIDEEDYPLALDLLDRIVTLEPDYVEGWNKRATVHFINDDLGKSLSDLERVLVLEPRHFGALAGLGTIMRELGDNQRALVAYRQALELDPYLDDVQKAIDEIEKEVAGQDV